MECVFVDECVYFKLVHVPDMTSIREKLENIKKVFVAQICALMHIEVQVGPIRVSFRVGRCPTRLWIIVSRKCSHVVKHKWSSNHILTVR